MKKAIPASLGNPLTAVHYNNIDELNIWKKETPRVSLEEFLSAQKQMLNFSQNGSRCALSLSGYYGDSGLQSARGIFSLDESGINALLNNEDQFKNALSSRIVWRTSDKNQVLKYSPVMLICAGFSNDYELPPFFPMGRNQDGAFGYAVNACLPESLIGHFDFSINHAPLESRAYQLTMPDLQMRINDIVTLLWVSFLKKDLPKNHEEAGRYFLMFAEERAFFDKLKVLVIQHLLDRALSLERKIAKIKMMQTDSSKWWCELAQKEYEMTFQASQNVSQQIPIEVNGDINLCRNWLRNYGELLLNWKNIRILAQELNNR